MLPEIMIHGLCGFLFFMLSPRSHLFPCILVVPLIINGSDPFVVIISNSLILYYRLPIVLLDGYQSKHILLWEMMKALRRFMRYILVLTFEMITFLKILGHMYFYL